MKTILVDAIDAFVIEEQGIFKEMQDMLDQFPNRKVLVTSANDQQIKQWGLDHMPYEVFTLKHSPEKTDPEYYRQLLKELSVSADDTVYFEHNPEAVNSAESVGISTYLYDPNTKDLDALKEYLEAHL